MQERTRMLLYVIVDKETVECFVEKGNSKLLAQRLFEYAKDDAIASIRSLEPHNCDDWSDLKEISGGALFIVNDIKRRENYLFGEDFLSNDTAAQTFYIHLLHKLWTNRFMYWANEGLIEFAEILKEFDKKPKLPKGYEFNIETPNAGWRGKQIETFAILKKELLGNDEVLSNLNLVYEELLNEQKKEKDEKEREQSDRIVNFLFLKLPLALFSWLVCSLFVIYIPLLLVTALWWWIYPTATGTWLLQQIMIFHTALWVTICPFLLKFMGITALLAILRAQFLYCFMCGFGYGGLCSIFSAIVTYAVFLPFFLGLLIFGPGTLLLSSFLVVWLLTQILTIKYFWNEYRDHIF